MDDRVDFDALNRGGYIVDTLSLREPVRLFHFSDGGYLTFLVEKELLGSLRKASFMDLLNNPQAFVLNTSFYSLFPASDLKVDCACAYTRISFPNRKGHEAAKFNHPNTRFILALVNINYFHLKAVSLEEKLIPATLFRSTYVKVAFPICE